MPTVTDADVVLGYLDPDNFLGGRMKLDKAKAVAAVKSVADQLGLSLAEAASGIAKIAEFKMADIIRRMTVEKGHDPRDFVLFAFGGAGPVHAAVFGAELGVRKVIVPLREIASTWCAFGAAAADILHVYEQVDIQGSPFDRARVNRVLAELQARAEAQMAKDGIAASRRKFSFSLDMRHRGQINEVEVMLPEGRLEGDFAEPLRQRFYDRYEQLYGRGFLLPQRAPRDRDDARAGDGGHAAAEAHESAQTHGRDPQGGQARDPPDLLGGAEAHAQDADPRRRGATPGQPHQGTVRGRDVADQRRRAARAHAAGGCVRQLRDPLQVRAQCPS